MFEKAFCDFLKGPFSGSLLFWANSKPLKNTCKIQNVVLFQFSKYFVKTIYSFNCVWLIDLTRFFPWNCDLWETFCAIFTLCFHNSEISDRFYCMTRLRNVEMSILWAVCVNECGMIFMHIFRIFFAFKKDHHSTSVWYSCQLFCLQWPS